MNDPILALRDRLLRREPTDSEADGSGMGGLFGLQVLTGKLLFFTGLATTVDALAAMRRSGSGIPLARNGEPVSRAGLPAALAPALVGPLAAAAHMTYAFTPSERNRTATRVLDAAVVGAGFAALVAALAIARREGAPPSVSAVALASAGALGILLDRNDREHSAELGRLEKRASVVERLVPRRRTRIDKIVVHV